ncbi:MAG: ParA family protein [Dorea sp.]|nr:ParA family protein [Dorea sp.]
MAHTIVLTNQKGGVGKTTTSAALAAGLARKGYKVLAVDMDPQGNMGFSLGVDIDKGPTIYEGLKGDATIYEIIHRISDIDIIQSNILLSSAEATLKTANRELLLKNLLEPVEKLYDYIIIDTPPAFNILTLNGYSAANYLIIPMSAEILSLVGLVQLKETYETVRQSVNSKLKIMGIILTKYEKRRKLSRDVLEMAGTVAKQLNTKVFNTVIRSGVAAAEAPAHGMNIFEYSLRSAPARDYGAFIEEILRMVKEDEKNGKKDE